ncbi:hypothetical protein H4W31_005605 [Plantactinospora soyae]|uniref:Uncharacterized protein n=1 Tax=Plantactinospora soyae TaxID=1544732 RepID=A0A927M8J6_9ACTN|nr:hypothetical protein [Plantactinospora soyae]
MAANRFTPQGRAAKYRQEYACGPTRFQQLSEDPASVDVPGRRHRGQEAVCDLLTRVPAGA